MLESEVQPFIQILANGPVDAADVTTALDQALDGWRRDEPPHLTGRAALQCRLEGNALRVERLFARTRTGRRVRVEREVLPLPIPKPGEALPIRIGFAWEALPVADGSAVQYGRLRLSLLAAGEAGVDGELALGTLTHEGIVPAFVPADRLDASSGTLAWLESARELFHELDAMLMSLASQLDRDTGPKLTWLHLISHVLRDLADGVGLRESSSTEEALDIAERCRDSFRSLPFRAVDTRDPHLIELWSGLDVPLPPSGMARHEAALESLRAIREAIQAVAATVGIDLEHLPGRLYRGGRLYRKRLPIAVRPEGSDERWTTYRFPGANEGGSRCIAVLWRADRPTSLGDVRSCQLERDRSIRPERFHEGIAGTGYHWFSDVDPSSLRIRALSGLGLIEAAEYEPLPLPDKDGTHA